MENALVALSNELAAAVAKAGQYVVTVHGRPRMTSSGVLWKPGVVVTADHTLRRDEDIRVTLPDGKTVPAEIAGRDPGTDIAVLKVDSGTLTPVQSPPDNSLEAGMLVLAIGRSHETGVSAALGVISSVSGPFHTWRGGKVDQFIRLDVGLYPGASGGAVVSANGNFAGIATGGLSRTSALAIPAQTIARVVDALLEKGHVSRGFLGVGLQPVGIPQHLRTQLNIEGRTGLMVLSVEPDGPAGKAGIFMGDVLISLEGKPVADTEDVQAVLGPESVGRAVQATILRGGTLAEVAITVGERPRRRA